MSCMFKFKVNTAERVRPSLLVSQSRRKIAGTLACTARQKVGVERRRRGPALHMTRRGTTVTRRRRRDNVQ